MRSASLLVAAVLCLVATVAPAAGLRFIEVPADAEGPALDGAIWSPCAARSSSAQLGLLSMRDGSGFSVSLAAATPGLSWSAPAPIGPPLTIFHRQSSSHWCEQISRNEFPAQPLAQDRRIKAAVIADPLAVFFTGDSFAKVEVPVQLWASEHGGDGVTRECVAAVNGNLPANHEYHLVPNSGHFAFLIPCPPALARAIPEICSDAPGFDRSVFHDQFNADVLAFFRAQLGER
jgi:pimeloyl-ACP methyl ester carboxylesterase